jgi:TonB family protein
MTKYACMLLLLIGGCTTIPAPHEAKAVDTINGPFFMPTSRDYYPLAARRQGITGRVGLECSVDERGYAQNIVVVESGGPLLDDAAKRLFSDVHFLIPSDWSTIGGPTKRFRYGAIFQLLGKPRVPQFDDDRHIMVITRDPNGP